MRNRAGWLFAIVMVGAACLLSFRASSVPLFDPDEARFARTSVEMMRDGDVIVPHFEGRPRLVKPPMVHWLQSSIFRLFGVGEGVARLHSTLATLLSLLLAAWVAASRWGEEAGIWCAAILATMPLVVAAGFFGTIDALLAVHVFAVIALDMTRPPEGRPYDAWVMGALLGLAFLAKGPVGVVVPLLVMLAGRTAAGRYPVATLGGLGRGALAWSVVALPWGLAFLGRVSTGSALSTLRGEALERFFAGTSHIEPPWFYLQVLLVGLVPWCVPLVAGTIRAARERNEPGARSAIYAAAGLVAGLVFFSLSKSKLPTYILPLAPLAALVVTWELGRQLEMARTRRSKSGLALALTLGFVAVVLGLAATLRPEPVVRNAAGPGALLFAAGAIVAVRGFVSRRPRSTWGAAAIAAVGFLVVAMSVLVPELSRTHTSAWLVESVPELTLDRPVAVVDMKLPSLTYYLDRVPEEIHMSDLAARLERSDGEDLLLVFDEDDLAAVTPDARAVLRELGRQGKYVVFERVLANAGT